MDMSTPSRTTRKKDNFENFLRETRNEPIVPLSSCAEACGRAFDKHELQLFIELLQGQLKLK